MTNPPTPLHALSSLPKPEPSASEAELELMAMMRFAKDQYALASLRAHVAEQLAQSRAALAQCVAALQDVAQLIAGWKATTPDQQWSEFDEETFQKVLALQQVIERIK